MLSEAAWGDKGHPIEDSNRAIFTSKLKNHKLGRFLFCSAWSSYNYGAAKKKKNTNYGINLVAKMNICFK